MRLTDLTKKDQPNQLKWGDAQDRAFENLKSHIVKPPILRLPDFAKQLILPTHACNSGIGAILLQGGGNQGLNTPIAFASRKLLTRESHYLTIEKKMFGHSVGRTEVPFLMGSRLFWRLTISHCSIWEKPNIVNTVAL